MEIYLLKKKKSFPQMHTNTSSQKNQHRDILAKKKKKTQTEKQTNPNGKTKKRQIGAYRNDRSSWVSLGRSSWVWVLIGARSYGSVQLWIGAAVDQCLWSELWIGDRSCDDVDWFVTKRQKMRQRDRPRGRRWDREIDREGEDETER